MRSITEILEGLKKYVKPTAELIEISPDINLSEIDIEDIVQYYKDHKTETDDDIIEIE